MLAPGSKMPDFILEDQHGNQFDSATPRNKHLVIFFYPKDYTPGCTAQVCGFRDEYEEFQSVGADLIGISGDSTKSHQRFSKTFGLPFPLLSDPQRKVHRLFGVGKQLFGLVSKRVTFVVDTNNTILMAHEDPRPGSHIRKALKLLLD